MARYPQSVETCIARFCEYMESESQYYTERTVAFYREHCHAAFKIISEEDPCVLPQSVTREHIQYLFSEMQSRGYAIKTLKLYMGALKQICRYYHNNIFDSVKIRYPVDVRPNVDWLSNEQVDKLISFNKTPAQELVVHLELFLGFRKIECVRLTVNDLHDGYLDVRGKGSASGKLRRLPYHKDTQLVLDRYLKYRAGVIEWYTSKYGYAVIPDNLMIWASKNGIMQYSGERATGIDRLIHTLSKDVGFKFSSHTLRRTFGRILYRSGVPIATISKFYGHDDLSTTIRYLGLDMDDMTDAMKLFPY